MNYTVMLIGEVPYEGDGRCYGEIHRVSHEYAEQIVMSSFKVLKITLKRIRKTKTTTEWVARGKDDHNFKVVLKEREPAIATPQRKGTRT